MARVSQVAPKNSANIIEYPEHHGISLTTGHDTRRSPQGQVGRSRPPHGAHALQEDILQRTFSHRNEQMQQLPVLPCASKQIARCLPASSRQTAKQLQGQEVGSFWVLLDCTRRGWSGLYGCFRLSSGFQPSNCK